MPDLNQNEIDAILHASPKFSRLFSNFYAAAHGGQFPAPKFVASQCLEVEAAGLDNMTHAEALRMPGTRTPSTVRAGLFNAIAFHAFYKDPAEVDFDRTPIPCLELMAEPGLGKMAPLAEVIFHLTRPELFQLFTALAIKTLSADPLSSAREEVRASN